MSDDTTRNEDETTPTETETETEPTARIGAEETSVLGDWRREEPVEPVEPVEEPDETRRGFHPLQTGYLVVGLLAVGVALMWLLTDQGAMEIGDGGVAFSIVLVTAGAVGLVASLGRAVRRR